jgi:hypothetical protein
MSPHTQFELMRLMLGWAIIGAFLFTLTLIVFTFGGYIKFAEKEYQTRLLKALLAELFAGGVAFGVGIIEPRPLEIAKQLEAPWKAEKNELSEEVVAIRKETDANFRVGLRLIARDKQLSPAEKAALFGRIATAGNPQQVKHEATEEDVLAQLGETTDPTDRRRMKAALEEIFYWRASAP